MVAGGGEDTPSPAAAPSTAAITGVPQVAMSRTASCTVASRARTASGPAPSIDRTSPPAENVPPAPVSTIARTSGSPAARRTSSRSRSRIGMSIALRAPGRFSVMTRAAPWSSAVTTGSRAAAVSRSSMHPPENFLYDM